MDGSEIGVLAAAPGEVVIGVLVGVSPTGEARVRFPLTAGWEERSARSAVPLSPLDAGCDLALIFEAGDAARPFIIGRISQAAVPPPQMPEVTLDGERVELTAASEIVLRCGKASLTLTRNGKIVLRGTYILSRSSGPNRIKGGSVQLN